MSDSTSNTSAHAAAMLREIGGLLALELGNGFRARAYSRAADVIESVPDLEAIVESDRLTTLPGIGRALAAVIREIVTTGRSRRLESLRAQYPPGAVELSEVLSLPRIRRVFEELGVTNLRQLREACEAGRVRELRGFGKATERRWIEQIDAKRERRRAVLLPEADGQAAALLEHLRRHPAVRAVELAGDLRRRTETVDRLELVVATSEPEVVAEHARQMPGLATLDSDASDRAVLHRVGALDAHLHFVPQRDFAVAWIAATGSRAHTAKLARIASRKRLSLDGRALRASTRRVAIASEQDLYERLGLAYVPPEMREDWGELEAAENGTLSTDLVTAGDVRGAVHCHTVDSDGKHTIEQMARAAEALGLQYLTITDHSVTASYAGGLDVDRLRRQADEIARVQSRVGIRLLRGTESDILRDGSLDYPDEVLEQLDVVIASVHQRHKMDTDQMTRRLLRAIRHPLFKIWGHALGRYVLSRPPFECRMDEVLDAVAESRAAIEINGDPHRLDLEPRWIRRARERGIRFVVSTDAHSTRGLENVRFGIDMARRGGLRKRDVLNTLGPEEFLDTVRPAARERRSTPGRRPTRRRA